VLLAQICERASGQTFAEFCRERILEPPGMIGTSNLSKRDERHAWFRELGVEENTHHVFRNREYPP
jgi:CubicO group peptidase (beta-lactamase class C family)